MAVDPKIRSTKSFPFAEYGNEPTGAIPDKADEAVFSRDGAASAIISNGGKRTSLGIRSTEVPYKPFGACINNATVNQAAGLSAAAPTTYGLKGTAEAPFDAVKLVWVNRATNAINNCSALVGVTETATTTGTSAQQSQCVIGGVTYSALAAAGSINGWRPVTWGGAATVNIAAAATVVQFAVSDWIPLSSIARTDGGSLPLWQLRAQHDGAVDGNFAFFSGASLVNLQTANQGNRGRIFQAFFFGQNAVTTPAFNGSLVTSAAFEVFPIFRYRVQGLSVMLAGDSITQNDALASGSLNNWGWRGCADASSQEAPIQMINMGCSSKNSLEYWTRTQEIINAGVVPDVLVIGPASVNDGYVQANLDRIFETARARAFEILAFAEAKGIRYVVWTPLMPYNVLNTVQDGYRKQFNAFLQSLSYSTCLNFGSLGDGATPERWNPALNDAADGIHPNDLAIDTVMAPALATILRAIA